MKQNHYDIQDTEIRIIGDSAPAPRKPKAWLVLVGVLLLIAVGMILFFTLRPNHDSEEGIFERTTAAAVPHPLRGWLNSLDSISAQCVVTKDTIVNDIPMRLYVPLNTTPRLEVGYSCIDDTTNNLLLFQAADVRADNKKIVGAFVLRGKPLSWGLSKKGYCGIIGDEVTVGVADNSPLFEQATEEGGYFFRQYPLVCDGELVDNEPKGKSIRRAICDRQGEIFMVETLSIESFHDFSQALVDLGVDNAIYLVGSNSYGWAIKEDGTLQDFGDENRYKGRHRMPKNTSYIVWKRK